MMVKIKSVGGMTMVEALVTIALLALLAAVLLPGLALSERKQARLGCVNCLKESSLAFHIWSGDNNDKFPMQVYATNNEMMQAVASGNACRLWQIMSNELSTPRILHCPNDQEHIAATNFTQGFSDANISYFFNLDATEGSPQTILDGDDNLALNGTQASPGILNLQTNRPVGWTLNRHHGGGNLGLADGSVMEVNSNGLDSALATSGTNLVRLVIP